MSIRTPLAHARGLGSAKTGTGHWWAQRLTAIALIPLTIWFVISLVIMTGSGHDAAIAWIGSPLTAVLLVLLIVAGFHHMQLGLQVVIEDYVHNEGVKVVSMIVLVLVACLLAALSVVSILKVALGS